MNLAACVACALSAASAQSAEAVGATVVRGRLLDDGARPIVEASARMLLGDSKDLWCGRMPEVWWKADPLGEFRLSWVDCSEYLQTDRKLLVVIEAAGRGTIAVVPSVLRQRVTRSHEYDIGDLYMPVGYTWRGTVRDAEGDPVPDARVAAINARDVLLPERREDAVSRCGTWAFSNRDGTYVLTGVSDDCIGLQVSADGHYTAELATDGNLQEIVVHKSGLVSGTVVDSDDSPIQATVRIRYADNKLGRPSETDPQGRFYLTIERPGEFQLTTWTPPNYLMGGDMEEVILSGPAQGVTIRPKNKPEVADRPGLAVRVTDRVTGGLVKTFRAAAVWFRQGQSIHIENEVRNRQVYVGNSTGPLRLSGPPNKEDIGVVVVKADGYIPWTGEVRWPVENVVDVEMEEECVIRGVVVEQGSRVPIVGALVDLDTPYKDQLGMTFGPDYGRTGWYITDDTGRFRLTGVSPGKHRVQARLMGRLPSVPVEVQAHRGQNLNDLTIEMPEQETVGGRVAGLTGRGWWLMLIDADVDPNSMTGLLSRTHGGTLWPIDRTGSYRVHRRGTWEASIVQNDASVSEAWPLGRMVLGREATARGARVMQSGMLGISGKVHFSGLAPPPRAAWLIVGVRDRALPEPWCAKTRLSMSLCRRVNIS